MKVPKGQGVAQPETTIHILVPYTALDQSLIPFLGLRLKAVHGGGGGGMCGEQREYLGRNVEANELLGIFSTAWRRTKTRSR